MAVAKQIINQNIRLSSFLRYSLYLATHTNEESSFYHISFCIDFCIGFGSTSQGWWYRSEERRVGKGVVSPLRSWCVR